MRLPPFLLVLFVLLGLAQPTFAGSWVVSYQTQGGSDLNPSSSSSLAWPATISSPSVSQGQSGPASYGTPGIARSTGTVTAKFTWTSYYAGDTSPPPNTESLGVKVTVAANANATASQGSFTLTVRDGYGDPRTSPTATSAQSSGVHYEAVPVSQGTDGKWTATVPSCTLFAEAQLQGTRSYGGDYAGASVTYTAEPTNVGVRILRWNGSDYVPITDANRKVLPGQYMDLIVQVTGGSVQQNQWQIPPYPTAFKKYYPSAIANQLEELTASDLTRTNVAFYWTKGGTDQVVSNSVTIRLTTGELQTYKVQDTLTVIPPIVRWYKGEGTVDFGRDPYGRDIFGLLWDSDSIRGVEWGGDYDPVTGVNRGNGTLVTLPDTSAGSGKWNFTQFVTSNQSYRESGSNPRTFVLSINNKQALDERFVNSGRTFRVGEAAGSLPNVGEKGFGDSPQDLLLGKSRYQANDSFVTYIMFLPDGSENCYVPLEKRTWAWSGDAVLYFDQLWAEWKWKHNIVPTGPGISPPSNAITHPTWRYEVLRDAGWVLAP